MKARIDWARHATSCRTCAAALRTKSPLCELGASLHRAKVVAERLLADSKALL